MKEEYEDKRGKTRIREHWNAYGNKKKKDKSRYKEKACFSTKLKGHTHMVRVREKENGRKSKN